MCAFLIRRFKMRCICANGMIELCNIHRSRGSGYARPLYRDSSRPNLIAVDMRLMQATPHSVCAPVELPQLAHSTGARLLFALGQWVLPLCPPVVICLLQQYLTYSLNCFSSNLGAKTPNACKKTAAPEPLFPVVKTAGKSSN